MIVQLFVPVLILQANGVIKMSVVMYIKFYLLNFFDVVATQNEPGSIETSLHWVVWVFLIFYIWNFWFDLFIMTRDKNALTLELVFLLFKRYFWIFFFFKWWINVIVRLVINVVFKMGCFSDFYFFNFVVAVAKILFGFILLRTLFLRNFGFFLNFFKCFCIRLVDKCCVRSWSRLISDLLNSASWTFVRHRF